MQINKFTIYLFFLNGMTTGNITLTSLDYFNQVYKGYNVYGILPILLFAGPVMIGLSYNTLHRYLSYKSLINLGYIISNVGLVLMILVSILFKNNPGVGFNLSMILTVIIGIGISAYQLSFLAIMNYLSRDVVALYTIGTAAGDLLIVFLRMIILATKGPNSNNISAIIIYYTVAISINILAQLLNFKFFASEICLTNVLPYQHREQNDLQVQGSEEDMKNSNVTDEMITNEKSPKKYYYRLLYEALVNVHPNGILIYLNYVQTFMLFPNLTTRPLVQASAWPIMILMFFFNFGDTLGKIFCNNRKLFNQQTIIYLLIARMYFFWSVPGITQFTNDTVMQSYVFIYANQFLFSFTNGIITNGCFVLAYQKASLQYKKYAGIACGLLPQMGILTGTLLAFPFDKLF